MKQIYASHLGRHVKLGGRVRPEAPAKHRIGRYMRETLLPRPPRSTDFSPPATASLSQAFGNDDLSDCVIAAGAHFVGVTTGNAKGKPAVPTMEQILGDYRAIGGYVPGKPATDKGCDEHKAFAYWKANGFFDGTKLKGWAGIDATNKHECMSACFLLEGLFVGGELPEAWVTPLPSTSGFVWDVAGDPVPANGHAFLVVGYEPQGLMISSWGLMGLITWAAAAKYLVASAGGDMYGLCTPDQVMKARGKAPNGIDWDTLLTDFQSLARPVVGR